MASELRVDRIVPVDGVPNNGGGGVVQVVQASTNTQLIANTDTWTDTTLSATITPKFSTSKILMITNHSVFGISTSDDNIFWGIRYLRDATVIFDPQASTIGPYEFGTHLNTLTGTRLWYDRCIPPEVLDSPNTTSAVTYKTQCRLYDAVNNACDVRFQYGGSATAGSSYITLMEISA